MIAQISLWATDMLIPLPAGSRRDGWRSIRRQEGEQAVPRDAHNLTRAVNATDGKVMEELQDLRVGDPLPECCGEVAPEDAERAVPHALDRCRHGVGDVGR